jgi:hypothetical protein
MTKVQLSAQLLKVESRADRTYKLIFNTQELQGERAARLLPLLQSQGWLLFSTEEMEESDIPDEKPDPMTGTKTQAQRLRGVIYRIWEQGGRQGDSEGFYRSYMERIIGREKANFD